MTRRMSATRRAKIFAAHDGVCHICEQKIDGVKEPWDVEHVIPLAISADDTDDNLRPAHRKCHKAKTKQDAADIAKCKRVARKHIGARISKNPIPGGRNSKWKKSLDGSVKRR